MTLQSIQSNPLSRGPGLLLTSCCEPATTVTVVLVICSERLSTIAYTNLSARMRLSKVRVLCRGWSVKPRAWPWSIDDD